LYVLGLWVREGCRIGVRYDGKGGKTEILAKRLPG
jgi:hypothetical protein